VFRNRLLRLPSEDTCNGSTRPRRSLVNTPLKRPTLTIPRRQQRNMGDTPQSGGPSVEHHPAALHNHLKARRLGKGADVVERIGIGHDEVTV